MAKLPKPVPVRLLPTVQDVYEVQLLRLLTAPGGTARATVSLVERVINGWHESGHPDLGLAATCALASYYALIDLGSVAEVRRVVAALHGAHRSTPLPPLDLRRYRRRS